MLDLHREFVAVSGDDLRVVNFFEERKTCIWKFGLFVLHIRTITALLTIK
jgi:hypothetical protein